MNSVPVILLAAGQSSRMGGADKLLQPVDGQPLLRRAALRSMTVGPVLVALPPAPNPRYGALNGLSVKAIPILDAAEGMNASLRGAMAHVPPNAPAVMVLLADLPDLTEQDLNAVARSVTRYPDNLIWRGATQDMKAGHPVVFARTLFAELSGLTGDSGAQSVVRRHKDKLHLEPLPSRNALRDLDTPEDWAQWRAENGLPK